MSQDPTKFDLTIGCFNARSICNKTPGVLGMMKDNGLGICCITESWLRNGDKAKFAEIHDHGYEIFSKPRRGRGGGVAFLFDPKVVNPVRNNTSKFSSFEVLECLLKSGQKLIRLCVVYRSTQAKQKYESTKLNTFYEQFDTYLESLLTKSGDPIICGDFNFHIEDNSNVSAKKFLALCESKGFVQKVSGPTHISGGSLDLLLSLEDTAGATPIGNVTVEPNTGTESDHFLVTFQVPFTWKPKNSSACLKEVEMRDLKKIDVSKFREDVFTSPLNLSDFRSLDLDSAVQLYNDVLQTILDKHAPVVTKKINTGKSPFWNESCQDAVRERRRAKRRLTKNPSDPAARATYHEKSVDAEITINKARNTYYSDKLSSLKGDSRGTYKVVGHLLDKQHGANRLPNGEDDQVAEQLKDFFDEKVKGIYTTIEDTTAKMGTFKHSEDNSQLPKTEFTHFQHISTQDLEKIIKDLPNKSSSLDIIPISLFRDCLPELFPIVHFIINESITQGRFPRQLKSAAVRPGLKKPGLDVDELKNYRPISNLTYLSKILEKVVHCQMIQYLSTNDLFCHLQSGYRKHHSCETAITRIHNDLLIMIDKKENVVLLLLDLSAAFDTINHEFLLQKLKKSYGIKGTALSWFKSYLTERTFKVTVNNVSSNECVLEIGVPQGSILGPLLFILYTKDLERIVSKYGFSIHLYADDTQVYFSFDVHSPDPDMSKVKECFRDIKQWMSNNYLKLNDGKTEFLDIGPYVSPITSLDLGETSINPVEKAKNLGFIFDHKLSLSEQVSAVSQVCYINQRNLTKIGSKLNHELKIQLVSSHILGFLDYCNAVYCGLLEKDLRRLQKIQNNAVRFIFGLYGKRRQESITPYLQKLHFLPVKFRILFKVALLVFKCINNLAPSYLQSLLSLRQCNLVHSSRLDDDFYLLGLPAKPNSPRTEAAFSYCAPKIWNDIPWVYLIVFGVLAN